MEEALIIFIKNAELGKVKTRLASTVGDAKALQIYLELLRHTREVALQIPADRLLFYSNFIEKSDNWSEPDFQKYLQVGADLGQRMVYAFEIAFQAHSKVLVIGSDCASLTKEIIQEAFQKLKEYPYVIGPAMDGGYYLLGMNSFEPSLFENIEWSTDTVLANTLNHLEQMGQSCYLLPELSDIDYEEDWDQYGWKI